MLNGMPEPVRKKILVVDDELSVLLTIKRFVLNAGYDVLTASNGKEAVESARKEHPDLIVMDAVMPEMNGLEATREIRKIDALSKVPIIMLTALRAEDDIKSARLSGVTEFLIKPVDEVELVHCIRSYLRSPFGRQSAP
jgi:CheY-like chemotaxis protein